MFNKFLFQLYGDSDDLKVSDVLEVLNSISKQNSGFENSSEEAKKVLEQESGSNLVNNFGFFLVNNSLAFVNYN
jgi:hypothetical protein